VDPYRGESGQASVELIAALPALLLALLIAIQIVIAGYGLWTSATAARVGARAAYVGGDAQAAARSAVPTRWRRKLTVRDRQAAAVALRVPGLVPGAGSVALRARSGIDPQADGA
jgi:hypothetical protein